MEMNVLLDPYILAVPDPGERSIEDYLENLYTWTAAIVRAGQARFWLSFVLYEALQETDVFPTPDRLRRITRSTGDFSFDVQTTLRACQQHLYGPPVFDDLFENQSWYYEHEQVVLIPEAIAKRLPEEVANALRETLALATLGRREGAHVVFDDLLFATVPNGFQEKTLHTRVVAHDVETSGHECEQIEEEWMMVFSPEELDNTRGLLAFWEDTHRAVEWARRQVAREGFNTDHMVTYRVGQKFNSSIVATHMDRHPHVMEALFTKIVKCLCGIIPRSNISKGSSNHPIRKGRNSHEQVSRKRGNGNKDTAWRLRIQGMWRLHYWLLPDGTIELANVEYGHAMHIEP